MAPKDLKRLFGVAFLFGTNKASRTFKKYMGFVGKIWYNSHKAAAVGGARF